MLVRPEPKQMVDLRFVIGDHGLVHGFKSLQGQFEVLQQAVAEIHTEILADDNTHQLWPVTVGRHGVCWHNPTALT